MGVTGLFLVLFIGAYILQQQMGIAYTLGKKDAIADANKLTKPMTADEMAKFFDMDKENIACQLPEALTQCECFFSDKWKRYGRLINMTRNSSIYRLTHYITFYIISIRENVILIDKIWR